MHPDCIQCSGDVATRRTAVIEVVPLNAAPRRPRRIALGKFDGLHLGHRAVLHDAETVVTFDRHPLALLAPERAPRTLTTIPRRAALAARLGVREMVVLPFDDQLASMPPQQFIDDVLVEKLSVEHVSVGANFRFGHRAEGDVRALSADPRFATRVAPLVELDGRRVSSTLIREAVAGGDLAAASRLLGAPFVLPARIVDAALGTALVPEDHVLPPTGVYVARAVAGGYSIEARVRVGANGLAQLRPNAALPASAGESVELELLRRLPPRAEERQGALPAAR